MSARGSVVVIGSGLGGLAVAVRLAASGLSVLVLEKGATPGGRAAPVVRGGFTFDAGPTVVTAPFLFDELFELAGRRREERVQFLPVRPFYRLFDVRGSRLDCGPDLDALLEQIRQLNPADREGFLALLDASRAIFQRAWPLAQRPFLTLGDMVRILPDLWRMKAYRTVYSYVSRLLRDDFLRRCFSFHPLFLGGNPLEVPAIYALIHELERTWGVWYPRGGMGALVHALVQLLGELGGRLQCGREVVEILVERGRAVGVRLRDGSTVRADAVVADVDPAHLYLHLLPPDRRSWLNTLRFRHLARYSMSLFIVYFATDRTYAESELAHHNIVFGPRYQGLLRDIFHARRLPEDFSLYVHMPTRTDPSVAPPGCATFYVLAPVPNLAAPVDWEHVAARYREGLLRFLEERFLRDLRRHLLFVHHVDPRHFARAYNTHLGTGFTLQPVFTQSAWFRPHNRSRALRGLYLVGAGTHPGPGLPGVLLSARITQALVEEELSR